MDNWGKSAPIRNWYPHPIGASFDSRDRQEAILSLVEIQGEKARESESQWRQKKRCHRGNGTSSERNEARRTTVVAPESSRSSLRNSGLASESQEAIRTALLSQRAHCILSIWRANYCRGVLTALNRRDEGIWSQIRDTWMSLGIDWTG